MKQLEYLNFDLQVDPLTRSQYRVQVVESPAGQAEHQFHTPFNKLQLENFYLHMGQMRGFRDAGPGTIQQEIQRTREFGQRLFSSLFGPSVYACYRISLDAAREQNKGLRIRLHLNAPELSSLPWEFLYDPNVCMFLSCSIETPIVRYIELPYKEPLLLVKPPLNMLVVISNPLHNLDVQREWGLLSEALAPLQERSLLRIECLTPTDLDNLQRRLRQEEYNIFHFIGHGGFDDPKQGGGLLFEGESGKTVMLRGDQLGRMLSNHKTLRLVVLNACEGARASPDDPFTGVAQRLVQMGLPAVVAMQFPVSDRSAITFADHFYGALADGFPVDAALVEARTAISLLPSDLEWGTPVYFTRADDGRVFDIRPITPSSVFDMIGSRIQKDQAAASPASGAPAPRTITEKLAGKTAQVSPQPPTETAAAAASGLQPAGAPDITLTPTETAAPQSETPVRPQPRPLTRPVWLAGWILVGVIALGCLIAGGIGLATYRAFFAPPPVVASATPTLEASIPTARSTSTPVSPTPMTQKGASKSPAWPATATPTPAPTHTPEPSPTPTPLPASPTPEPLSLSVPIAAGVFLMGEDPQEAKSICIADGGRAVTQVFLNRERPPHQVYLDAYELDRFEVTVEQYADFLNSLAAGGTGYLSYINLGMVRDEDILVTKGGKWIAGPDYSGRPMVWVTWFGADAYCQAQGAHLPTEAQWERAARGVEGNIYAWGDTFSPDKANFCDNQCLESWGLDTFDDGFEFLAPVDTFPGGQSSEGVFNLTGNVWEWVADWYGEYSPATHGPVVKNPPGSPKGFYRVIKGGAWNSLVCDLRASARQRNAPSYSSNTIGFRCAR